VKHALSLFITLYALWLLLSGYWTDPLLLSLGLASVALTVFVAWRMEGLDHEGVPVNVTVHALVYWPWLLWQIVLANLAVAKVILAPRRATPRLEWVPASQRTDVGRAIYANSITLTPGTISVQIDRDRILVHALESSGIDDLIEGAMDRRVAWVESPLVKAASSHGGAP